MYDTINAAWDAEVKNEELQDLKDLQLNKMTEYLSKVRFELTETAVGNQLQADLLSQEALNLEFMLKDLLMLRRSKIVKAALAQKRPHGELTLSEEEFYNRLIRGIDGHLEFVTELLTGLPSATLKQPGADDARAPETYDEIEYILVKFVSPIKDAFLGIDEATWGPFEKGDIATIPVANARRWLQDGTIVRVAADEEVHL
jgi:DNA replication initiation complex subunit (GINS family)